MDNKQISKILYEISQILEIQDVPFKPRAYEKAAMNIETMNEEIAEIYKKGGIKALEDIPGVGVSIAEKIEELIKTNKLKYYADLKKKFPVELSEMSAVEGLGPKNIAKLYKELGIKNLKTLEAAARAGKISKLPHFGKKSEKKILSGIEFLKKSGGRMLLSEALPLAEKIISELKKIRGVKKIVYAGSLRRMQETVGDLDLLATTGQPKLIMDAFIKLPEVESIHSRGEILSSVRLKNGRDADLRVVPPKSFGAALQYFTGDKQHNIEMRKIAIKKGYKLNEYGLWKGNPTSLKLRGAGRNIAAETEEEIYKKLGMNAPPPELRTASGEIESAMFPSPPARGGVRGGGRGLSRLVGYNDIKGDLQMHTNWTDGGATMEKMAEAAKKMGYRYIAFTDHTKALAMTGGLNEADLARQGKEIDELNKKFKVPPPKADAPRAQKFKILKSAEINILKDGSLDIKNEALKKLDIVSAAVHTNFHMMREEMTARIVKAMQNPYLNILFHPTGRIINRRKGYEIDIDEIIKAAKKYGVALEIDAYPNRLDLKDEYIRKAVQAGVKLVIDTDSHAPEHLQFMKYGIAQARRGWAKKSDILNTLPAEKLIQTLKKLKSG